MRAPQRAGRAPERQISSGSLRAPEMEWRILLYAGIAGAPRRERAFAYVAQLRGPGDRVPLERSFHRNLEHLAVFGHRPHDRHLIAGDAAVDRPLAVLVGHLAGQLRARL